MVGTTVGVVIFKLSFTFNNLSIISPLSYEPAYKILVLIAMSSSEGYTVKFADLPEPSLLRNTKHGVDGDPGQNLDL